MPEIEVSTDKAREILGSSEHHVGCSRIGWPTSSNSGYLHEIPTDVHGIYQVGSDHEPLVLYPNNEGRVNALMSERLLSDLKKWGVDFTPNVTVMNSTGQVFHSKGEVYS